MLTRQHISNGCLIQATVSDDIWEPCLAYQLTKHGKPCSTTATLLGRVNYAEGKHTLVVAVGQSLDEWDIAETATQESLDELDGYQHGKAQQRRRHPGRCSEAFYRGWVAAWRVKREAKLPTLPPH